MRKNLKKVMAGALMLTVLMSTGCSSQNGQQTTETQSTAQTKTENGTEAATTAPAETAEVATGGVNYGSMEDTSIRVEPIELMDEWDKVFALSDEVNHRKVTLVNHFGNTLAADLYEPKEYTGKLPAIAVAGPFGAVKEQSSGLYAQEMAKRGFLAIAFDPSFTGESGGYPRYFNSPDINIEDYQAALDTRIKATAAMTMYDMSRNTALGYFDSLDEEGRYEARIAYNNQRTEDYKNGAYTLGGGLPEEAPAEAPQYVKDYVAYYKTDRGYHARSVNSNNGWAATAGGSLMNMRLFEYAPEIQSSVLLVHGENAHSLMYSQDAFKLLKGDNKELMIIPDATPTHTDLYDQMDKIPFDKLESFFMEAFQ